MTWSKLCPVIQDLDSRIHDFLVEVPSANEESITDYLVWQWRLIDRRFKFMRITPYTRHAEGSTTGADYSMDLWIVGPRSCIPLLVQAKKFVEPFDAYRAKLNYPNGTRGQLRRLMSYANSTGRTPIYAIYTPAVGRCCCRSTKHETGVHVVPARRIGSLARLRARTTLPLNRILSDGQTMHDFFCSGCYHQAIRETLVERVRVAGLNIQTEIPPGIRALLDSDDDTQVAQVHFEEARARIVADYDLRNMEEDA